MPSDNFGLPVCVCGDHSYSRAVRLTDKRVRATFVVYCHDPKLGSWQPLQGRSHVARPDAPPGSVFQLDDMALVVVCNQHSWRRLVTMALSLQRLPVHDAGILRSSLSVTNTCCSLPWPRLRAASIARNTSQTPCCARQCAGNEGPVEACGCHRVWGARSQRSWIRIVHYPVQPGQRTA